MSSEAGPKAFRILKRDSKAGASMSSEVPENSEADRPELTLDRDAVYASVCTVLPILVLSEGESANSGRRL